MAKKKNDSEEKSEQDGTPEDGGPKKMRGRRTRRSC